MVAKLILMIMLLLFSGTSFVVAQDDEPDEPEEEWIRELLVYDVEQAFEGYTLIKYDTIVGLMDMNGDTVWQMDVGGRTADTVLLEDGRILSLVRPLDFPPGGNGVGVRIFSPTGDILWDYHYTTDTHVAHHDVEMLPNGHILLLAFERFSAEEAIALGADASRIPEQGLELETLVEIDPATDEIVWKWASYDHLIQDVLPTQANYGSLVDNPHLIDINYNLERGGNNPADVMHANAIGYDAARDVVFMSVAAYNEIWFIDHSTTTEEAATGQGGNFGKGGDLVYRFGNPSVYDGEGAAFLHFQHYPNLLQGVPGEGHFLVFSNGESQSTVYEVALPDDLDMAIQPEIVWSYQHPDLFSQFVSGAQRLPNGNTLIVEGDFGFWEVNAEGDIVWQYGGIVPLRNLYWRPYRYAPDYAGLAFLNIGD